MSETLRSDWRLVCGILFAVAVPAHVARGQTVAEYTHRADSLTRLWKEATAKQVKTDSTQRAYLPPDTLRIGNFVILTDSAHLTLARAAAEQATSALDAAYGSFATRLRSRVFVLRSRTPQPGETAAEAIESGIIDDRGQVRFASREFPIADPLARSWEGKAAELLTQELPPIHEWLGLPIPVERPTQRSLQDDRVELVLSASQATHDCAAGSTSRCLQALALAPVVDPAFALFNDAERRDMIERNAVRFRRSDPAQYARCTNAHVSAACDSIVRSIPLDAVPAATGPAVRRSFLRYALMVGGAGAFDRLVATDGSLSERLSQTSKMPIDSLARRWQQALMESRASSNAIDVETAVSAVLWAAACCALALRSSRWR